MRSGGGGSALGREARAKSGAEAWSGVKNGGKNKEW